MSAELGTVIVSKVLALTVKSAWSTLLLRRYELAREVITKQLKRGRNWAITEDAAAAALFTYIRAAEEGVARLNLELMAEALVTAAEEPTFSPDEFRRHASRLADLSREEVLIVAEFIKTKRTFVPVKVEAAAKGDRISDEDQEAMGDGQMWGVVEANLLKLSGVFTSKKMVHGFAGALTRTGWISYVGGFDDGTFIATPMLDSVARLVEWPEAWKRAASGMAQESSM